MCSILPIVKDIYLLDFYERKTNSIVTSRSNELDLLFNNFEDSNYIRKYGNGPDIIYKGQSDKIGEILEEHYPLIHEALIFGKGKLSLTGLSVLDVMTDPNEETWIFDMCIHSCNELEVSPIIQHCLELFNDGVSLKEGFVQLTKRRTFNTGRALDLCLNISYNIFKNRDEMLINMGPIPMRHGYDPVAKYFTTFNTALSLAIRASPIDIPPDSNKLIDFARRGIISVFHGDKIDKPSASSFGILISDCSGNDIHIMEATIPIFHGNSLSRDLLDINTILPKMVMFKNINRPSNNPREYFGNNYQPIVIGISNERYAALSNVTKEYFLPDELLQLLCGYWLTSEALTIKRWLKDAQ